MPGDDTALQALCQAVYKHEAAWYSPSPRPSDETFFALERALEPVVGTGHESGSGAAFTGVAAEHSGLVAEALSLAAHGHILPEGQSNGRRSRNPRAALDRINLSLALSRASNPPCPSLLVLQRLRLRANALFVLRSYRPARDDLLEALRLLRVVAGTLDATVKRDGTVDHLKMLGLWILSQWATVCFNLSLCARYLNSPDEALLWIDASASANGARAASLDELAEGHPVLAAARLRVDPVRVGRGMKLLRRIVSADTTERLMAELNALQDAATGDTFAGGLALVQAYVERFLVVSALRKMALLPPEPPAGKSHQRTRSGTFFGSIAAAFSGGAAPIKTHPDSVSNQELCSRLPADAPFAETPRASIEKACLDAANDLAGVLTDGHLTDISPCLSGHLPSFLQGSSSMARRHAMVTLLDFALTNRTAAAWRAAMSFAAVRGDLKKVAAVPEMEWLSSNPVASAESAMEEGERSASPASFASADGAATAEGPGEAELGQLLREYTLEEELVLFDFNPVTTQSFLIAVSDHQGTEAPHPHQHGGAKGESPAASGATSCANTPPPPPAKHESPTMAAQAGSDLASELHTMTEGFTPAAVGAVMTVLTAQQRHALHQHLPQMLQGRDWHCVFTTREHGTAFSALFSRVAELDELLLVVKPMNAPEGTAFGAFVAAPLQRNKACHSGGGESFVFTFDCETRRATAEAAAAETDTPESTHTLPPVCVFPWSQRNSYINESKPGHLSIGGGGNGAAIYLREYLRQGATYHCETFDSPPLLAGTTGVGDFGIAAVEIFAL